MVLGAPRETRVRGGAARGLCRAVVFGGIVSATAAAGLLTAASALASNGSQPGNLILRPASGASNLKPTWSTKDACPAGFRASAGVSEFRPNGALGRRISSVVSGGLTRPLSGTLEGTVAMVLALGANAGNGQTSEWAIGCYSGPGGRGNVKWVQSTFVTLSANGKSYSTSSSAGKRPSTTADPASSPTGNGVGVPIDVQVQGATPTSTPTSTPTVSATPTASATPAVSATPTTTSTGLPGGGPATGAGGASSHSGSATLIALGAAALAGSAAATGLAIRRRRAQSAD
jgi:hypothetical protein